MILKGWYSQAGWRTKLILINESDKPSKLRIKLFEGENGRLLATINMKLKPKEMRFYELGRIKRVAGKAGIALIESSEELVACEGHLVDLSDEMKVIDYKFVKVDVSSSCC
ncbi:MAG: hypothetical protein QXO04_01895 [Nitrososphaerota archaeon]